MTPNRLQLAFFRARAMGRAAAGFFRRCYWSAQGMAIGRGTLLPKLFVTWPHQVAIGADCAFEPGTFFRWDGLWSPGPRIRIGDRCFFGRDCEFNLRVGFAVGADSAIASGCKFIDHDHGIVGETIDAEPGKEGPIVLGKNVWLGVNAIVLRGVTIGDGAVVAAGAVVTKSIPACEIWGGVPARKIGVRSGSQACKP